MNAHKKFFSKVGANYLIMGVTAIILQIILFNIINMTNPEYLGNINFLSGLSSLCNYILVFPLFYWLMKKLDVCEMEKANVGAKTFIIYIGIVLTLMWAGNIIGLVITNLLGTAIKSDIANPVQQLINNTGIWFNMLVISIIAPICEEILFRKLLIDRTIKYGAKVSIILSAVIFAFFHANLNQFFYAFLMGGFLAYVYVKTGKITYSIVLHGIVNFMGSVVSIFLANSLMNFQTVPNPIDGMIIIVYFAVIFSSLVIGLYGLAQFRKAKLNGEKTKIALKHPFKTVFLNYGMILFILFYVFEMAYQVLG